MKTEKVTIDLTKRLPSCLDDPRYLEAEQRRAELEQESRRQQMGLSFGDFSPAKTQALTRENEAVESLIRGEEIKDTQVLLKPREAAMRRIELLQKALERQTQIVKQMLPALWRENMPCYNDKFRELFQELIDSAERFAEALKAIEAFQNRIRSEARIDEIVWPGRWRIGVDFKRRLPNDVLDLFIEQARQLWSKPSDF